MQLLDTTQVLFSAGSGTKKGVWVLALSYPKPLAIVVQLLLATSFQYIS